MKRYFFAFLLEHPPFHLLYDALSKHNPVFKYIPLHVPLTPIFESTASPKEVLEKIKPHFENLQEFQVFFRGLFNVKKSVHLRLVDGETEIKKIQILLHSMSILKDQRRLSIKHLNPLVAVDKHYERILEYLPIRENSTPTFKVMLDAIHLIEIEESVVSNLGYRLELVKGHLPH